MQNTHVANSVGAFRRLALGLCLGVWLLAGHVWAQDVRIGTLNTAHPMVRGLLGWWVVQPATAGGSTWWDVLQRYSGTLVNLGVGAGWMPTARPGWLGEMRFDGTGYIAGPTNPVFDFANTTVAVCGHFRAAPAFSYLASKRCETCNGGLGLYAWFVRLLNTGEIQVRIENNNDNQRATVGVYTDGLWHSFVVNLTTDTVTAANNTITIYVDGVLDQGAMLIGDPYVGGCPTCRLVFGSTDDVVAPLTGAMQNLRIYNRALSATEAMAYHRERPPDFGGMVILEPIQLGTVAAVLKRRITIE
jgi:Concanavalin A-like lectin/glucanases superfamily